MLRSILFILSVILTLQSTNTVMASSGNEFPVLYQARFRPAEAYAKLWLYELYHAPAIKSADLEYFKTETSSPLPFLWSLNFKGYTAYTESPLFWIGSAEMKQPVNLPLKQDRFSYQTLHHLIYENSNTSQVIIKRLAAYFYLQTYIESLHKKQHHQVEISTLLPGLWLQWEGDDLVVASVPSSSPWLFLKEGEMIQSNAKTAMHRIIQQDKQFAEGWSGLINKLREFERFEGVSSSYEQAFLQQYGVLKKKGISPKEIERLLEQEFPLSQRLKNAGFLFHTLPSKQSDYNWLPINALDLKVYDPSINDLKEIGNFTSFTDSDYLKVKNAYTELKEAFSTPSAPAYQALIGETLSEAFAPLSGLPYQIAHGKQLHFPSLMQLKLEALYIHFPWIPLLILLYCCGACLLIASFQYPASSLYKLSFGIILAAIFFHTALLLIRCFILQRPPVSNMFETVIYVPWVAACTVILFPNFRKQPLVLLAACLTSIFLLIILEVTDLNQNLDQVQAVLDSQFWLLIHVLMVVGSYGIFILGAILGHFYLVLFLANRTETSSMNRLGKHILQTMYGGTILLITGTILGGIWAAESWGRFWDWDPKESWAFISSCFYLIWIHAYRFNRIGFFGLAIGSIIGLLSISFTWYGVNYILGTGLHSYGFGSGGEFYYYTFILAEILLLLTSLLVQKRRNYGEAA